MTPRLFLLIPLLALTACGDGACVNDVQDEVLSPDGAKRAVLFLRRCGGDDAFVTHVSVINPRDALEGEGNVLVLGPGNAVEAVSGAPPVEAEWTDDLALTLRFAGSARVMATRGDVADVVVTFEEVGR